MNKTLLCRVAAKIFVCVIAYFREIFPKLLISCFVKHEIYTWEKVSQNSKEDIIAELKKHESFLIFLTCWKLKTKLNKYAKKNRT